MRKSLITLLVGAAVFAALPATARAATVDASTGPVLVRVLIAELPVADESRAGYVRTAFKHWVDADKDGCNTRNEVLKVEAVTAPEQGAGCKLTGGSWFSYYDDTVVDGPSGLDIDHMVPLAEAWDSGASAWTAQRREVYANDLGWARSLVAVTARSNRQKADQDPTTWLPPAADAQCQYVEDWVSVKIRWGLSVDPAEKDALATMAAACPDDTLDVPLA